MTVGPVDVRYKGQANVQTGILNLAMRTELRSRDLPTRPTHRAMSESAVADIIADMRNRSGATRIGTQACRFTAMQMAVFFA